MCLSWSLRLYNNKIISVSRRIPTLFKEEKHNMHLIIYSRFGLFDHLIADLAYSKRGTYN